MEVNLAIDQGNTSTKAALFHCGTLIEARRIEEPVAVALERLAVGHRVHGAIYCSVSRDGGDTLKALKSIAQRVIELDHRTPMPMAIDYATPATLGHDRIAAAAGAAEMARGRGCLVVDAGTAMTLDTVTTDGRYRGGNISPGLHMRIEALHHYTSRLPVIDAEGSLPLIGRDTATAIRSGVEIGIACEIDGYLRRIERATGSVPMVIVTGGDCRTIAGLIEAQAVVEENLVLKGLNRILLYNEKL